MTTAQIKPKDMTAEDHKINDKVIMVLNQIGLLELMKKGADQFGMTPDEESKFEDMCDNQIMEILSDIDGTEVDSQFTLKIVAATEDFLVKIRAKK